MMTTTMDSMKELHMLAQRVAAASRDHSLLPELRLECQRNLAGIDPESTMRASADYRAGQAEILCAILTAIEERTQTVNEETPQKTNKPKMRFRISPTWWILLVFMLATILFNYCLRHK